MDPNTDLDAGPHTDPNLGIQDIIMSQIANLNFFETEPPPPHPPPPPPRTLNQKSMVELVTKIIFKGRMDGGHKHRIFFPSIFCEQLFLELTSCHCYKEVYLSRFSSLSPSSSSSATQL
jgi:hypothetical protein